jgi:hypothetical protein
MDAILSFFTKDCVYEDMALGVAGLRRSREDASAHRM